MIVPCECGAKLKIDDAKIAGKSVKVRCPRCGNVLPVSGTAPTAPQAAPAAPGAAPFGTAGPLILVAHDSEMVRNMVADVLADGGFRAEPAENGHEALQKVNALKPQGMVLDVGLPGIYGFELCERLKGNPETSAIKIVLLSAVYDMRRYKRTPVSLYGADDYIEKHHIPDALVPKLRKLIEQETAASAPPERAQPHDRPDLPEMSRPPAREFELSLLDQARQPAPPPPEETAPAPESAAITPESLSLDASVFQKEEYDMPNVDAEDPEAVEKAKRFARIIVSDIALYNQEAVIEGIRNGTFYELLQSDVQEGRELYEKRVPTAIRARQDYYQEAFDNFLAAAQRNNVR